VTTRGFTDERAIGPYLSGLGPVLEQGALELLLASACACGGYRGNNATLAAHGGGGVGGRSDAAGGGHGWGGIAGYGARDAGEPGGGGSHSGRRRGHGKGIPIPGSGGAGYTTTRDSGVGTAEEHTKTRFRANDASFGPNPFFSAIRAISIK
jgi:hypothetical protein